MNPSQNLSFTALKSSIILSLGVSLFVVAVHSVARAQVHFSPDERRIITIADERRDADSLLSYLSSATDKIAWRAAIGIANIGDPSVRPALLKYFLDERRDSVADAEAFALGMLGPDAAMCKAVTEAAEKHPTLERLKAIARTAPKSDSATAADIVHTLADHKKIDLLTEAQAYVDFALHHESGPNMLNDLELLADDDNPDVRWRAAYSFARGDSADLVARFLKLNDLLQDQGSIDVRMFAAMALGKLHDPRSESALARSYRGEDNWQVRVNILRAFSQFPSFDSLIMETIQLAVSSALLDSSQAMQVGLTAADLLEHFVRSGTLTPSDSIAVRSWLDAFNGTDSRNDDIAPAVCARLCIPSAQLGTPTMLDAIRNYSAYKDPNISNDAMRAAGTILDSNLFKILLEGMQRVTPSEQVARLEAIDSEWQLAKHHPAFRNAIEADRLANVFRGLLIHISDAVQNPAVDATALTELRDTSIVQNTARRDEAMHYVEQYIPTFCNGRFRDALLAAVVTDSWLGDTSNAADLALRTAYDTSNNWHDYEIMDSIATHIHQIEGAGAVLPKRLPRVSHIDWNEIENIPPRMILNFIQGSVILHLCTDETPLTVLNMVRLARDQWFAGNSMHRVVPNFVVQSGDPTGTGWGGPGYTIRSEITPRTYDRQGMVGMASDGKDTEGSQWFITECPTPHLNTHYTIWAEVMSGMDVVLQLKAGDIVSSIIPFQ